MLRGISFRDSSFVIFENQQALSGEGAAGTSTYNVLADVVVHSASMKEIEGAGFATEGEGVSLSAHCEVLGVVANLMRKIKEVYEAISLGPQNGR